MKTLQGNHGVGHALFIPPVVACMKLLHQLHQGLLLPVDLSLMLPGVDILCVGYPFNPEQLVGSDHHFDHLKGAAVFIESEILLCFENFVVSLPHSLATITNPPQLVLLPQALLSKATRDPHLMQNFLWMDLTAASSVSKNVRESPVDDLGLESAVLSHESMSESDSALPG